MIRELDTLARIYQYILSSSWGNQAHDDEQEVGKTELESSQPYTSTPRLDKGETVIGRSLSGGE